MNKPELNLEHLSWDELINNTQLLLDKDAESISRSEAFYRKLYYSDRPNQQQLERLYNQILQDQERYNSFSEVLNRLQKYMANFILEGIEKAQAEEKKINNKMSEDFSIFIYKEGNDISINILPLRKGIK